MYLLQILLDFLFIFVSSHNDSYVIFEIDCYRICCNKRICNMQQHGIDFCALIREFGKIACSFRLNKSLFLFF